MPCSRVDYTESPTMYRNVKLDVIGERGNIVRGTASLLPQYHLHAGGGFVMQICQQILSSWMNKSFSSGFYRITYNTIHWIFLSNSNTFPLTFSLNRFQLCDEKKPLKVTLHKSVTPWARETRHIYLESDFSRYLVLKSSLHFTHLTIILIQRLISMHSNFLIIFPHYRLTTTIQCRRPRLGFWATAASSCPTRGPWVPSRRAIPSPSSAWQQEVGLELQTNHRQSFHNHREVPY